MAKTVIAAAAGPLVHTGPGKLIAILLSTTSPSVTTFTFYDNTAPSGTVLLAIALASSESPVFMTFPTDIPTTFQTGLYVSVAAGANYAHVWAIGF